MKSEKIKIRLMNDNYNFRQNPQEKMIDECDLDKEAEKNKKWGYRVEIYKYGAWIKYEDKRRRAQLGL